MKINGNISAHYLETDLWNFGKDNLCLRAGTQGFVCDGISEWNKISSFPDNSDDPEYFKPIDPDMGLCLRVFTRDLGKLKIPQLALYTPELGFPLCTPEQTAYYRKGGLEYVYDRFFFTIPMLHINYGLAFKRCSNMYTVFFSNAYNTKTPFSDASKMTTVGGKYSTFPTGKNILDTNELYNHPATWPVEMDLTDDDALDLYFVSGTGPQDPMPHEAFQRYLPYWMLYYPVILKKVKGYVAGSAGNTVGAMQGYFKYLSPKEDAFSGDGNIWRRYFGIRKKYNIHQGHKAEWEKQNWNYKSKRGFDYQLKYSGISDNMWQELAVIRATIGRSRLKKKFSSFPFTARPKSKSFGRTKIHECDIRRLSLISQSAFKMNSWSQTEVVDVMCITCGYKALSNMHYLSCKNISQLADNCMWFNDIDMNEVIGERAKIKVGASS
mgnify:FL=1